MNNTSSIIIANEEACPLAELPPGWQLIADGSNAYGITDRKAYVQMAQLFMFKLKNGDLDIFNKREDLQQFKKSFSAVFAILAREALEFYAEDFKIANYPDLNKLENGLDPNDSELGDKKNIVDLNRKLFTEFGYDLPASFYRVHLAPVFRSAVCEIVPLRFSEQDKLNARGWDAALHGQKVFPMQMIIQSLSSEYGFVWEHGCGCNHGLSRVGKAQGRFSYRLKPEMRLTWIRDYLWTCMYEYAFFPFTPVTKLMTGSIVEFTN